MGSWNNRKEGRGGIGQAQKEAVFRKGESEYVYRPKGKGSGCDGSKVKQQNSDRC